MFFKFNCLVLWWETVCRSCVLNLFIFPFSRIFLILPFSHSLAKLKDDGIEYFNTVVVQPHKRLVTNQGKGYHIRCRYQTQAKTISNNYNTSAIGTTPVVAAAPMPSCSMKILMTESGKEMVAESVKIGDRLTLTITIDNQGMFAFFPFQTRESWWKAISPGCMFVIYSTWNVKRETWLRVVR